MPVKTFLKSIAVFMFAACYSHANAQYYAYIEAEGQQPFYLRVGQKLYSSNAAGFLIVPRLDGSEVSVKIGFPENVYPEVAFTMTSAARDRGYSLRLVDGTGWTLTEKGNALQVKGQVIGISADANVVKEPAPVVQDAGLPAVPAKTEIDKKLLGEKSGQLEMIFSRNRQVEKQIQFMFRFPKLFRRLSQ